VADQLWLMKCIREEEEVLHHVSKNCAFFFLSELHQISMNFNKFW